MQRRELRGQITDIQKEVVAYKLKSNTLIAEGNTLEQEQSKRVIPSALTALIGITFLFLGVFGSPGFRFPLSLLAIGMLVVAVRGIMRLRSGRNKLREMAREMDEIDAGNAKRANGIQQLQGEIDSLTINRQ
ncbi:MAG: hypothetical protein SH847_20820 [Roseiflexaceae bacterium]|nr:hypothetical protein [Roseiflexaceae bacterium]